MTAGVLVLPGWGLGPELLAPLVPERAAGVVWPGWGAAERPGDLVELALQAAARTPGDRLLVLGWSLGAMVALEAWPGLPERLGEVRLVAPCLRFCDAWPARVLDRMIRRCAEDPAAVLQQFTASQLAPGERWPRPVASAGWPAAALRAGLEYLARSELPAPAPRPGCRARVLHGGADPVIPAHLSRPVADALGAERRVLPGAGHAPHVTRAAESAAFLGGEGTGGDR